VRRLLAAALGVIAVVGIISSGSTMAEGAAEGEPPQLRRDGRWLVDELGRVVIVHGVNLVYKHDPYVPPETAEGFTAADADWLADHGFNAARVGTLWAGLTPDEPGVANPAYIAKWQRVMDLLADRGIWMQLDFHQDQWHETYGGEGVPDWAMIRPPVFALLPPLKVLPFPLGYWTPETSIVFDNFWANRNQLLDGFVQAWVIAAKAWKDQPYSMGYDLLNEPWAGYEWPTCLTLGCPQTYYRELQPAFTRTLEAIRQVDPDGIVWWEPQQFAGGRPVKTFFEPVPGEENLGLSWHNYCPDVFFESMGLPVGSTENCWQYSRGRHAHALEQSETMAAVPMMSEWGATDNLRAIEIDAAVADENLMGWTHWAYKRWNDPTTADTAQGLFADDGDLSTVKAEKVRRLVRTYAQATAGTPLAMSFDVGDGDFEFRYRPDLSIDAPTEIFVSPLHYPGGWTATVEGGNVVGQTSTRLLVRPTGDGEVKVSIRRS
jgi:endoglycosylceramidase